MDFKKIILYGALVFIVLTLWSNWQKEQVRIEEARSVSQSDRGKEKAVAVLTQTGLAPDRSDYSDAVKNKQVVRVKTDVLEILIDLQSGDVIKAALLDYSRQLHAKDDPVVLLNSSEGGLYVAQSGLTQQAGVQEPLKMLFTVPQSEYMLSPTEDVLEVPLTWKNSDGMTVQKTFVFKRGQYAIGTQYRLVNQGQSPWRGHLFWQLLRSPPDAHDAGLVQKLGTFVGASWSNPQGKLYQKLSFKKLKKNDLDQIVSGGWVAMQQHYFLSAWIPPVDQQYHVYTRLLAEDQYTIGMLSPEIQVDAGKTYETKSALYVGPEVTANLKALAPGLDLTVDYGWLWILSDVLFWLLQHIYNLIGNWGWAIVLLTLLIKLAFYKLSAMSYRSMAVMSKLQPRIAALKERYGNDKAQFSQEMMKLYRQEKANPLSGCLPVIVQIPFFIALYWVLLESVELRHAPFILWIHDLSAPDPYYILPLIMMGSMLLQQKMNPPPPDPTQAKVMMLLPVVFTILFINFPAGLVLYWIVNTVASVGQQWLITQRYKKQEPLKKKRARG